VDLVVLMVFLAVVKRWECIARSSPDGHCGSDAPRLRACRHL